MLAQFVNFVIVVAVLWRFALRPLMKTMEERSAVIEKSLKQAEEIERERSRTATENAEKLRTAQQEAMRIVATGKQHADEQRQRLIEKTKLEVEGIIAGARVQIQQEKEQMLLEAKKELADLVVAGVEKIVGTAMDEKVDKELIANRLNKLS